MEGRRGRRSAGADRNAKRRCVNETTCSDGASPQNTPPNSPLEPHTPSTSSGDGPSVRLLKLQSEIEHDHAKQIKRAKRRMARGGTRYPPELPSLTATIRSGWRTPE